MSTSAPTSRSPGAFIFSQLDFLSSIFYEHAIPLNKPEGSQPPAGSTCFQDLCKRKRVCHVLGTLCIISLNPQKNATERVLLTLIYRGENSGSEKLSNLFQITQLVVGRTRTRNQLCSYFFLIASLSELVSPMRTEMVFSATSACFA